MASTEGPTVRAEDIHPSRTDPITGRRYAPDWGRRFVEIDRVVLEVEHPYRTRGRTYSDHLDPKAVIEWVEADQEVFIFGHTRWELVAKLAEYVTTKEWAAKRTAWMAVSRTPRRRGTHRIVRRGPRDWWALPNAPARDQERGPWKSERSAREAFGSYAVPAPQNTPAARGPRTQGES